MSSPDDALQARHSAEVGAAPAPEQTALHALDLQVAREALRGSMPARKRFVEHMR